MRQIQLQVGITSVDVLMPRGEARAVEIAERVLRVEATVTAIDSQAYWQCRDWKPGEPEPNVRAILEVLLGCSCGDGVTTIDVSSKRAVLELGHRRGGLPDARWLSWRWRRGLHRYAIVHGVAAPFQAGGHRAAIPFSSGGILARRSPGARLGRIETALGPCPF